MNVLSKIKALSLGKKIYAGLWTATGAVLITLIGMFVGLDSKYKDKIDPPAGWSVKSTSTADQYRMQGALPYAVLAAPTQDETGAVEIKFVPFAEGDTADPKGYASLHKDFKQLFLHNAFIVGDLPTNLAAATADVSNFSLYAKVVRDTAAVANEIPDVKAGQYVELNKALINDKLLVNTLFNTISGTADNAVNAKQKVAAKDKFAFTTTKVVNENKLAHTYVNGVDHGDTKAGSLIVTEEKNKDGTHKAWNPEWAQGRLLTPADQVFDGIASIGALYDVNEWKTEPTKDAKSAFNATASIGALFLIGLMGSIFTTVGVSIYTKRKGGAK